MKDSKLLIAVPSKNRSSYIFKDSYDFIRHSKYIYKIFVEPQDFRDYSETIPVENLIKIPFNDKGLYFVKHFIFEYAVKHNYEYVFNLDDDLVNVRDPELRSKGYQGRVDREDRVKRIFDKMIEESVEVLDKVSELGAVAIKYGNELHTYDGSSWVGINRRLNSNYIIRSKFFVFPKPDPDYFGLYFDFFSFFNLLKLGYHTVQYGKTGLDIRPVGVNAGGLQSYDRGKIANKDKEYLEKFFPFVVWKEVKNKEWKYEPDFRKTLKNIS